MYLSHIQSGDVPHVVCHLTIDIDCFPLSNEMSYPPIKPAYLASFSGPIDHTLALQNDSSLVLYRLYHVYQLCHRLLTLFASEFFGHSVWQNQLLEA